MRVFAISDLHVDYELNRQWVAGLSHRDFTDDILIVAGDISDSLDHIEACLTGLALRFKRVLYIPGNHEMWVLRNSDTMNSIAKFMDVIRVAQDSGASTECLHMHELTIVPLLGWYDYSFGTPCLRLRNAWMDFRACRWPGHMNEAHVTRFFAAMNQQINLQPTEIIISFSHFLPRIDLIDGYVSEKYRYLFPIMGADILERQIREIGASIHVYGHSHVNRKITLDGVTYINNAFGYPSEAGMTKRQLVCIYDASG